MIVHTTPWSIAEFEGVDEEAVRSTDATLVTPQHFLTRFSAPTLPMAKREHDGEVHSSCPVPWGRP